MSHHGRAPKMNGVSPLQYRSVRQAPTITSALRRGRAESSRPAPPPERQRAQWRACTCCATADCALEAAASTSYHGRARRRKQASRRCGGLLLCKDRPRPERHGARARQARVLRLLPRDSERSDAPACAARPPAERWRPQLARLSGEKGAHADAVAFFGARTDYDQSDTARERGKFACRASTLRGSERSGALARATRPPIVQSRGCS